nr:dynein intermediate chain 3, ciliary-like isoform X3 [Osmia lignaria]
MATEMLRYSYIKPRYQFGKQCVFEHYDRIAEEAILPDPKFLDNYILRLNNNCHVQKSVQLAVHEVQTKVKLVCNTGTFHTEGGWPKEINVNDNEAVYRYRRRIERHNSWAPCLKKLVPPMEHCVLQNGAVNIHEEYFDDLIPTSIAKHYNIKNRNSYTDPQVIKRPIRHLSWCASGSNRLAAAYSFTEFEEHSADVSPESYIWDIENSSKPYCTLKSSSPLVTIEFNPRDPVVLVAGLLSGQVCCWDIRTSGTPIHTSHPYYSHRFPVSQALWIPSKVNTEFFSASTDGAVLWWDTRFPRKPSDILVMDLYSPSRADIVKAIGVTALQYEQTISSRFLAGMQNGMIINVNKRNLNRIEKLASKFMCYTGPVVSIDRNPAVVKNFLTIGDRSAKVWADDTKEGCFLRTREDEDLSGGCWSKSRCSVFYVINTRGELKAYDILAGIRTPLTSIHVCQNKLTSLSIESNGTLIGVGNHNGNIYLLQCSEDLTVFSKDERNRLSNYLDRCGRYQKGLDNRMKELRLIYGPDMEEDRVRRRPPKKGKRKDSKTKKKEHHFSGDHHDSLKRKTVKLKGKSVRKSNEPPLEEAEDEYFRRIEEDSGKYVEVDKEDVDAAQELLRKRIVGVPQYEEEDKVSVKEEPKRERRSIRKIWSRPKMQKELRRTSKESKEKVSEDMDPHSARMRRKRRSRQMLKKICGAICKPEICCKDMEEVSKAKRLKEAQQYKLTIRLPEKVRSSLIQDKLFRKLTTQLDEIPDLSPANKRRMLTLKNAPPNVLRKELQIAKEEVRAWQERVLAGNLSSWIIERKLEEKTSKKIEAEEKKEPKPEPSSKQISELSMKKKPSMSKDSLFGRKRSMKKRKTMEHMKEIEAQRQQELWNRLKQKVKEHDEKDLLEMKYPRISAALVKTSSEDLQKRKSEVKIEFPSVR